MSGAWGHLQPCAPEILAGHGVLTSAGDSSLNIASDPNNRKRKRSGEDDQGDVGEPFILRPHPSSPFEKPMLLTPRLVLCRSLLPLSYLDPVTSSSLFPATRFFSTASLPSLEAPLHEVQRPKEPIVLIAELEDHGSLFAVERVQHGIYALCKLAECVKLEVFEKSTSRSLGCISRTPLRRRQNGPSKADWWSNAAIEVHGTDPNTHPRVPEARLVRNVQLCMQQPPHLLSPADFEPREKQPLNHGGSENLVQDCVVLNEHQPADCGALLPEEIYEMIRVQYQEALYMSKTSLAYFAKGPLSRARAAFFNQASSSPIASNLIEFLRTIVLSLPSLDTKYRETLPSLVQNIPAGDLSEEDLGEVTVLLGGAGRKPKQRKKVGKNGLFPGEEQYLAKWWGNRDLSAGGGEGRDAELRRLLIEQRVRETELQMIVILETLALEALEASTNLNEASSTTATKDEDESQSKKKKRKKPQDLNTLLELLIDRLCIWQSMGHDEAKLSETNSNTEFKQGRDNTAMKGQSSDRLRGFCIEVVVPFYGARLPELSATICQKLGGPTIPSPVRKPLAKAASTSHMLPRPGAPMQRSQMRNPRKTLERVLTDEASAPRKPHPSLSRSATDSMIPGLKRETCGISLAAIPVDRSGIQKSKRFSQREVDLSAVSQATEAKLKKKASVEQELKGAIAALKRPNPRLAVKELVESAERRAAGSGSNARKSKHPVRNPFAQGVQVMATPKGNRRKDVLGGLPRLPRSSLAEPEELEAVPPSSDARIPSSSVRRPAVPKFPNDEPRVPESVRKPSRPMIEQTPTRRSSGSGRFSFIPHDGNLVEEDELCQSSPELPRLKPPLASFNLPGPILQRTASHLSPAALETHQQTPSKKLPPAPICAGRGRGIQETPVKASKTIDMHSGAVTKYPPSELEPVDMDKSIYESLGWDDEVDELM